MRRFYAPTEQFQGDTVRLDPEETRHLARVLRLGVGARVQVCDGRGRQVEAEVLSLEAGQACLKVMRELDPWGESSLALVLAIGFPKGGVLDEVIRQATELGVQQIIPFISERSERPDPRRAARRLSRWQKVARESLKSCQRALLPQIEAPREFPDVLTGPEELKLIFWEEERGGGLSAVLTRHRPLGVRVLIGPEGGFAAAEVAQAREAGFRVMSLGPRRLKVETAALAALTLMQYAWGDLA
jgi:16S rRNA (uracil1498-N3)-methyltransferase